MKKGGCLHREESFQDFQQRMCGTGGGGAAGRGTKKPSGAKAEKWGKNCPRKGKSLVENPEKKKHPGKPDANKIETRGGVWNLWSRRSYATGGGTLTGGGRVP